MKVSNPPGGGKDTAEGKGLEKNHRQKQYNAIIQSKKYIVKQLFG